MVKECKQTKRAMIGVLEHSLKKAEIYSHSAEVLMKGTTARKILITALNSPKITKALSKLKNKSVVRQNSNEVEKTTANQTSSEKTSQDLILILTFFTEL